MMLKTFSLLLILSLHAVIIQSQLCPAPTGCDLNCPSSNCDGTSCACATSEPCQIALNDRPQIVYLTFDDAFTALAEELYYRQLFDGTFTNPDGCPIRATHFITHQSNDYALNNLYYQNGHEFASHSITHRSNTTYWKYLPTEGWIDELAAMKSMLTQFALIPPEDIVGTRAPYFQAGGDQQLLMMQENGFLYDCSLPNREYGFTNMENGIWPYTLDYANNLNCQIEPCPTCQYPGIWEQPILDLEDNWFGAGGTPGVGVPCTMLESCTTPESTNTSVYDMMMRNFERAYFGNTRAPIGFFMHSSYFFSAEFHFEGYKMFLEEITNNPLYNQTWIVPVRAGIEYRQNPVTHQDLLNGALDAFRCDNFPVTEPCQTKSCPYYDVINDDLQLNEVRMQICGVCPPEYPWLGNPTGSSPPP